MKIQGIDISNDRLEKWVMAGLVKSAVARHALQFVMLLDVIEYKLCRADARSIVFMSAIIGKMMQQAPRCYNTVEGSMIIYAAWRFVNFDNEFVERLSSLPGVQFNTETIRTVIKRAKRAKADPNDLARATAGLVALEIVG